jgi:6-phosphogluconolactonase
MELKIYDTKALVASHFAVFLKDWLGGQQEAHIALSGGSTPKIVFEELAKPGKYSIDWRKVHLYWGDERCVSPSDAESNYKMTRDHLLSHIRIPDENVHRIRGEEDPETEARRYGALLKEKLPGNDGVPTFDLVILGMGEDGHTASIFPHEIHLWDSDRNCEVATHPDSGQKRITITGKLINRGKTVAFLVTGAGKRDKVAAILEGKTGIEPYPAALVHPSDGQLYWFLDAEAASGLKKG